MNQNHTVFVCLFVCLFVWLRIPENLINTRYKVAKIDATDITTGNITGSANTAHNNIP